MEPSSGTAAVALRDRRTVKRSGSRWPVAAKVTSTVPASVTAKVTSTVTSSAVSAALLFLILLCVPAAHLPATGLRETASPLELTLPVSVPPPPIQLPRPVVRLALLAGDSPEDPLRRGAEAAVRELNSRVAAGSQVVLLREGALPDRAIGNLDLQINQIENALARDVAGILIDPVDREGVLPYLERAAAAGTVLVTINTPVDSRHVSVHVATNTEAAVATVVEQLVALLGVPPVVAILSGPGDQPQNRMRREHLLARFSRVHPNVRILEPLPGGAPTETVALDAVMGALAANREIRAIIATDRISTAGTTRAVERAGRAGDLVVIGFDGTPELLHAGSLRGYLEESPYTAGYVAVLRAVDAIRGEAVPPVIDIPYRFVRPGLKE